MTIYDVFPKTIKTVDLDILKNKKTKEDLDKILKEQDYLWNNDYREYGHYSGNQYVLDKPELKDLKKEIAFKVLEFGIKDYGHDLKAIRVISSWTHEVGTDQFIPAQRHANSYISGCVYLKDGPTICFTDNEDGNKMFNFSPLIHQPERFPRSWKNFCMKPKAGMLIMFPSNLFYAIEKNKSKEEKYFMSFNTLPVGSLGTFGSLLHIK